RITHHAALAERFWPHLKLRLDEEYAPCARLGEAQGRQQGELQRNEAEIGDDSPNRVPSNVFGLEIARIETLDRGDARVVGEGGIHLAVPDINCNHMLGAALQEHLREATGRCSKIKHS